ncbi:MAG: GNAT family N-acetyltransferase [Armatimonadetes bacterium]|nr:GNAT family N-acetyltransferase [Anaerolineae bacterium]
MLTKTDLIVRNFQWSDLPAIVELSNFCQAADHLEGRSTLAEVENDWRSPLFTPELECLVVYTPAGQLIAYGTVEKTTINNRAWGEAVVHPDYRGQGIGTHLLRTGDQNYLDRFADEIDAETPIYVNRWSPEVLTEAITLLGNEGYFQTRIFFTMRIQFEGTLAPVAMPEGFRLKPFDPATDAYKVYQAQQEAFRDHWGWVADLPWEDWQRRLTDPHFDASLWFIAYEGDEIAGVSLCSDWGEDIPDLAWVNNLATRRQYRKRGLAQALLEHSFYIFQQRGYHKAGLGVDAASPTNAVALYERAGMHVHKRGLAYRKVLRGNPDLIKE